MPQGAYAIVLGDIESDELSLIVENGPYPIEQYPHRELPFIVSNPLALEGIIAGSVAKISQARPLQRHYNGLLSLIGDNIDAVGNSVIFAPREANLDYKKITNGPGNYIEYDAMGMLKPSREPGVPIPAAFFVHLRDIAEGIDEIFAFHEPSKGIMPEGGPKSAIGLQVLQEADYTQLSPIIRSLDESDERVVFQMLSLAVANYGERLIQVVGKDNKWTLEQINSQELNGKVNVIVRPGSSLPINKMIEQEKMVFAWQSGLLGNPQDPSVRVKVIKAMDLGGLDQLLEDNAKHQNLAKREFIEAEKLASQMPQAPNASTEQIKELMSQYVYVPMINDFDDHFTHQIEHTNFILDKRYEYIASGLPHLQILMKAMIDHNNMHSQAIYMQQLQALALQNPKLFGADKESKTSAGKKEKK